MKHTEYQGLGESCFSAVLPSGLQLRIVPKRGFAWKYAFLAVNFGAVDTAFFQNGSRRRVPDGIAHYLEHKMFDLPDRDAMELFAQYGGSPNAFTSYGLTAYYFSCTERFEDNLRLLLHMVATPHFTAESVEKERGIIAQEIRMYEDSAQSRVGEDLFAALFRSHPIRVPIAGTAESIAEITPELLLSCYRAFYRADNMMLCVVGDVDEETVYSIAEAEIAAADGAPVERDYGAAETMLPVRRRSERTMSVSMPTFALGYKCEPPQRGMETMRREIVGDLAGEILAGESSPLYERLYGEGLIDADFSVGYESVKDACLLTAEGDSRDPETVAAAIGREAERIRTEGFDRALFERLKKSALGRRMRDLDSFESICYRICAYYFEGVEYFRFPEAYAAITPEEVAQFLSETLRPERACLTTVVPKEESYV